MPTTPRPLMVDSTWPPLRAHGSSLAHASSFLRNSSRPPGPAVRVLLDDINIPTIEVTAATPPPFPNKETTRPRGRSSLSSRRLASPLSPSSPWCPHTAVSSSELKVTPLGSTPPLPLALPLPRLWCVWRTYWLSCASGKQPKESSPLEAESL